MGAWTKAFPLQGDFISLIRGFAACTPLEAVPPFCPHTL